MLSQDSNFFQKLKQTRQSQEAQLRLIRRPEGDAPLSLHEEVLLKKQLFTARQTLFRQLW